jgi:hypothetical protein
MALKSSSGYTLNSGFAQSEDLQLNGIGGLQGSFFKEYI